jgi:hypothetical protein
MAEAKRMTESENIQKGRYNSVASLVKSALAKAARAVASAMYIDYERVNSQNVTRIKQDTGIDVSGYTRTLTAQGILHSLDLHGIGGIRLNQFPGQLPLTPQDFELLPQILNESDVVELGDNKGPNGENRIVSRKLIGDEYVVVEEVRPKGGLKKLSVITMWKEKARAPLATPETLLTPSQAGNALASDKKSIPQPDALSNNLVVVTGNEFGEFDLSKPGSDMYRAELERLREKALRYYMDVVRKHTAKHNDNRIKEVLFSGRGGKKAISASANPDKLKLIKKLPELIENSIVDGEPEHVKHPENHPGVKQFWRLKSQAILNNQIVDVRNSC